MYSNCNHSSPGCNKKTQSQSLLWIITILLVHGLCLFNFHHRQNLSYFLQTLGRNNNCIAILTGFRYHHYQYQTNKHRQMDWSLIFPGKLEIKIQKWFHKLQVVKQRMTMTRWYGVMTHDVLVTSSVRFSPGLK